MASVADLVWSVGSAAAAVDRTVEERVPDPVLVVSGYVPVVVFVLAGLGWLTLALGLPIETVLTPIPDWVDPFGLLGAAVFHSGPGHFEGNMWILVPFGTVLTWLSSNRHVLLVAVVPQYLAGLLHTLFAGGTLVGSSGVAFAFLGAVLVRGVGLTFRDSSTATLLSAVAGVVTPLVVALFVLRLFVGASQIAHLVHLVAFAFAAMLETATVVSAHDGADGGAGLRFDPGP